MLAQVYDGRFQSLGKKRKRTKGNEGVEAGLERIAGAIETAMKNAGKTGAPIRGIGVGCPGPLDLDKGIIKEAPNLGWVNVPVKPYLEKRFGCPVVIANDVDAGVYGESQFGAARNARCVLGVFPGTGIGGGCVYMGEIIRGKESSCMEIGHVQVLPDGPVCGCGLRGCLEAVASRLAISAEAAQAAYRGQAPWLLKQGGTDLNNIRSGTLAESVHNGDTAVKNIIVRAATYIGRMVGGMVHLISPDVVILGGGLVEAMPKLILETVESAARDQVLDSYKKTFTVVPAKLGDDATALGAAAWARHLISR